MLIDTSGFLSLYESKEPFHQKAGELYYSAKFLMTTNYVLAEYTALAQVRGIVREEIIKFSRRILDNEDIEIIWIDENLHTKAVELIEQRQDKNYSLCDAVSFVIMNERGVTESLTTDKHFEQEGFIRLLK
jgi:uncharacterized protein